MRYSYDPRQVQWYMTSGIETMMHPFHRQKCVELIEKLEAAPVENDYLQVFEFSVSGGITTVKHFQEQPSYENCISYENPSDVEPFEEKVYIIHDCDHVTILLASEY